MSRTRGMVLMVEKANAIMVLGCVLVMGAGLGVAHAQPTTTQSTDQHLAYVQSDNPFSALVGRRRARRATVERRGRVDRYILAADDRALLFEDRASSARVQFLCGEGDTRIDCTFDTTVATPEILEVISTRGPRGDVIYKSRQNEIVLRIASYGGATVYWPGRADGAAASKSFGDDRHLDLPPASLDAVVRRTSRGTAVVSARVGAPITFVVDVANASEDGDYGVLADSITRTAAALMRIARDPTSAQILANGVEWVRFVASAERPEIVLDNKILTIRYAPNADIAGRLSSFEVRNFLENRL